MARFRETYGQHSGVKSEMALEGDDLVLKESMPQMDEILSENRRMAAMQQFGTKVGGFTLAARVPRNVYNEWRKDYRTTFHQHGMTWETYRAIKLNSRDFRQLRVDERKL